MKIFLLSESIKSVRIEGEIVRKEIDENNSFGKNLRKSLKKCDNFLYVCNDKMAYNINDDSAKLMFEGLIDGGMPFKNYNVLDKRTKADAKSLIENADMIFLAGGKLEGQLEFLKEINFKENLKHSKAVVVGKSAGAMNLGQVVYQYPEDDTEVGCKKWLKGLGLYDKIIIPHFNKTTGNEFCFGEFHPLKDYYLPDSKGKEFVCLPQGSYILIDGNKIWLYGESYLICDGKVFEICEEGERLLLNEEINCMSEVHFDANEIDKDLN